MNRSSAGAEGNTPRDIEARTALESSIARQRRTAEGLRFVNTQGRESIASADAKYVQSESEDGNWMA